MTWQEIETTKKNALINMALSIAAADMQTNRDDVQDDDETWNKYDALYKAFKELLEERLGDWQTCRAGAAKPLQKEGGHHDDTERVHQESAASLR